MPFINPQDDFLPENEPRDEENRENVPTISPLAKSPPVKEEGVPLVDASASTWIASVPVKTEVEPNAPKARDRREAAAAAKREKEAAAAAKREAAAAARAAKKEKILAKKEEESVKSRAKNGPKLPRKEERKEQKENRREKDGKEKRHERIYDKRKMTNAVSESNMLEALDQWEKELVREEGAKEKDEVET